MSYLAKLFTTDAISETPKKVIEKIADEVSYADEKQTIVEVGAGMGEISAALLPKLKEGHYNYYAFEIDPDAIEHLKVQFPQFHIISDSAFDFEVNIPPQENFDYFISSIPLSFYKKEIIEAFLEKIKGRLKPNGKLVILFSAAWLLPVFKKHLPDVQTQAFLTFPPYFLSVYERTR